MEFLIPGLFCSRAGFRRNIAVPIERFGDNGFTRLKRYFTLSVETRKNGSERHFRPTRKN